MAEPDKKRTMRDFAKVFFRRRSQFLLGWALFALAALVVADWLDVEYTASGIFQRRVDETLGDERLSGVTGRDVFESEKTVLHEEIAGHDAVEAAAEELGLLDDLKPGEMSEMLPGEDRRDPADARWDRVEALRQRIVVRWKAQSKKVDQITVTFTDSDRDIAYKLPNLLITNYSTNVPERTQGRLEESYAFLKEKVDSYRKQMLDLDIKKIELETSNIGLLEKQQYDIVWRMQVCRADLEAVHRLLNIAKQKYARLIALHDAQSQEPDQPIQVIKGPNPELERLGAELREYKVELDLLITLQHMTNDHPMIQTLLARIALMEERIRNTPPETVLQTIYGRGEGADILAAQVAAAQSEVEILTAEYDRVASQHAGYEKMNTDLEKSRKEYAKINEQIEALSVESAEWKQRFRQVEMALEAEKKGLRTDITAVQVAKRPDRAAFPKMSRILGMAFGGGLVFAALWLTFASRKDRTIAAVEDADFGVPVLGVIGEITTRRQRAMRAFNRWALTPLVTAILLIAIGLASLNMLLKLHYPDRYPTWREAPATFVLHRVVPKLLGIETAEKL